MALFDRPAAALEAFLAEKQKRGEVRALPATPEVNWPAEASLILEEETALELGNPGKGSLALLLWSEAPAGADRVSLIGPDLPEIREKSAPFGQVILVHGRFENEYECYGELRDAGYDVKLAGLMARTLPSRQTMWLRVNQTARDRGLSLAHLGAALIQSLKQVEFAESVRVLFITASKADLDQLKEVSYETSRIVGAMMKMNEEMKFDCDACEFGDVCEKVAELKRMRQKLGEGARP